MLRIVRKLNTPDMLAALHNWIYGPPPEQITLSLVTRLRNVEDGEAKFLLKSISHSHNRNVDVAQRELERILKNLDWKRDLKPPTIITTEKGDSYTVNALLDCGYTDSAIN